MPFTTFGDDIYAHHGRQLLCDFLKKHAGAERRNMTASASSNPPETRPVGILGAGPGGLYAALILNDLGIPYQIIEARDRVGGRLYTHKFPNPTGSPYNYFDVGAMRFPEISAMRRLFHLFDYHHLNNGSDIKLKEKLLPYYFRGAANNDTFISHNGVTLKQNAIPTGDPFQSSTVIQDTDDTQAYIRVGAKAIADDVIEPFATRLLADLDAGSTEGWEYLKKFDSYSARAYMSLVYRPSPKLMLPNAPLPTDVVNWMEAFNGSTGSYDRALSEVVLDAVAFGWTPSTNPMETVRWWCIEGGAFQIADCMAKYIRSEKKDAILLNKRVTSIRLIDNQKVVEVVTDDVDSHQFSHVISTIPLPVLRIIDLTGAGLSAMQSSALRELNYGRAVKIGMQFRTPAWWTTALDGDGKPLNIIGGQSYTDSPLKTIVYPSFGDVKAGKTSTLIASYCWTEDAERLGALIGNGDQILVDFVLRELARIHNISVDFLRGQLIDTFAWDWSRDQYTMGAFAFFGPGKFKNVFESFNLPAAAGRLHFAGEALSVRHAWVEGALTTAWRSVSQLLMSEHMDKMFDFYKNWGTNAEYFQEDTEAPSDSRRSHRDNTGSSDSPSGVNDELQTLLKKSLLLRAADVSPHMSI